MQTMTRCEDRGALYVKVDKSGLEYPPCCEATALTRVSPGATRLRAKRPALLPSRTAGHAELQPPQALAHAQSIGPRHAYRPYIALNLQGRVLKQSRH